MIIGISSFVHNAVVAAVGNCISGVSIGDAENKGTWRIDFIDSATTEQRISAQNIVMALDYDAYVQGMLSRSDAFETDASRIEILNKLRNLTPSEIEAFVRTRLNADGVTNLASAILFCKRVETAIVQIVKVLARGVKDNMVD